MTISKVKNFGKDNGFIIKELKGWKPHIVFPIVPKGELRLYFNESFTKFITKKDTYTKSDRILCEIKNKTIIVV